MIIPKAGELLRSTRTGDVFFVQVTNGDRVLLQSLDGAIQVLTGRSVVDLFYEEIQDRRGCCAPAQKVRSQIKREE